MKNNIGKKVIAALIAVLIIFSGGAVFIEFDTTPYHETPTASSTTNPTTAINEVTVSDKLIDLIDSVDEQIEKGEVLESNDIVKSSLDEEEKINDEGLLETDGVVEQENISYDGTNDKSGKDLLSGAPNLTYYSQADSRWGNIMYSNHKDRTQTIKSSGCGPTSAAMLISASKGITTPPIIAQLFNDNNMRTYSNGTAWNAWPFIADYFDFDFYKPTTSFNTMTSYLKKDKNNDGVADYFAVASCGSGLFTTGGHYIFLAGDKDGKITVYDPYYYRGKFNTASRKAAGVQISGNVAYVTESNFKKYGAVKQYWIYSNDSSDAKAKPKTGTKSKDSSTKKNQIMYVNTNSAPLNVRTEPKRSATKIRQLKKGSKVTVYKTKNGWSKISKNKEEWVNAAYLSSKKTTTTTVSYKTTINKTYKFTTYTYLYSKASLSGTSYYYKPYTSFTVKKHISSTVDKIYIPATGRTAYWKVENFK